jgi:uncharacterized protein (DUF58 family)
MSWRLLSSTDANFPSLSGSSDTRGHPLFRSVVMRWFWRFYSWRLTQAGRWLFWPTLAFITYTSVSLDHQSFIPLCYLMAFWALAFCVKKPKVKMNVMLGERVCAGEILPVTVDVEQTGPRAAHDMYVLPHRLPPGVAASPEDGVPLPPIRKGETQRTTLGLSCPRRGQYKVSSFRVETDFPFGIFRAYKVFPSEQNILVYPRFTPLNQLELAAGRRYQPGGVALVSVVGDSAEYVGNREYRDGDNVRDIDWRATARLNKPIVREYREEYLLRVAIVLDTHVPKKNPDPRREAFERAVSMAAAAGDFLARQEYVVDLFAAGPNLYHLMAGRSLAYLDQILDILACVGESPEEPFALIEPELCENLSRISSVVCVLLDWNESRRAFVQNLRSQGVGVKVLIVNGGKTALDPDGEQDLIVLAPEQVDTGVTQL